jgi:hypothetical protein
LQVEAYRNTLLTALNPENIFLFGNAGLGPASQMVASNQWSVYVRISKHFHWGKEMPGGVSLEEYAAKSAPLVGSVQGLVVEQSLAGPRPAPNVAVSLDQLRSVMTDASGHYFIPDVPEGTHQVGLDMEQLPTDYEPGPSAKGTVRVVPRAVVRADFNVVRLTMFIGKVVAPKGVPVENIVIRLTGTNRYTTPYQDGSFSFYNLREGEYEVTVDTQTVPEGYLLAPPATVHVSARTTTVAPPVVFELKQKPEAVKPVRKILEQEIHIGGQGGAGLRNGNGKGGNGNGTHTGNGKGRNGNGTHTGNGNGGNGNGTQGGNGKPGNGNGTHTGNGKGGNGNGTHTGNGNGGNGNGTQGGNGKPGNGNGTHTGNGNGGNGNGEHTGNGNSGNGNGAHTGNGNSGSGNGTHTGNGNSGNGNGAQGGSGEEKPSGGARGGRGGSGSGASQGDGRGGSSN